MTHRKQIDCAICGESLIGTVNRCWKCGGAIEVSDVAAGTSSDLSAIEPRFAPLSLADSTRTPKYDPHQDTAICAAAYTGLAVGGFAVAMAWFTGWALVPALIALGFAVRHVFARRSPRRWLAVLGLLLSFWASLWSMSHIDDAAHSWWDQYWVMDEF